MTIPFAEAATTELAFTYDYAAHLIEMRQSLPGFQKAKLLLNLFNQMEDDKIAPSDIDHLTENYPLIRQAVGCADAMAIMCQDAVDGLYFSPTTEGATGICIANTRQQSREAWQGLMTWVGLNAVSTAPRATSSPIPSAPV